MKRLIIVCEGSTEKGFCHNVLAPALKNVYIETPLIKDTHGGIAPWYALKRQIEGHLRERDVYVTMLIDYYGIKDKHQFPSWEESKSVSNKAERIHFLCERMANDISTEIRHRFIPYIQLHEFEGLLFSDISKFKNWFDSHQMNYGTLESARSSFETPELINNSPLTAPSKRLESAIPSYDKVLSGNCIAMDIGLDKIRKECPLFNEWVKELEKVGCA